MTKNNSQSPELAWNSDNEKTWWTQRSTLERRLMMLLVIIVVLITGYVIYQSIKPKGMSETSESCTTPACLSAASQIIAYVDSNADPCDDFFKFACGKLIEPTHEGIKFASLQELQDQADRQLAEIIKESISEDDNFIVKSQKELFQACMNESAVEEETMDIIKEHLKELKGWPVALGQVGWKEGLFDWTRMTYKLKRLGYHYGSMLQFDTVLDPETDNRYIIQVYEPNVDKIKDEHKELYKDYMADVAVAFGAERNQARIEMEKVLDFMESLRELTDKYDVWNFDDNVTVNYLTEVLSRRFTIDEYQDFNYRVDWLNFLNNLAYPVANISGSDYAIFPKIDFMEDFLTLIKRTRKRVQANYMIWIVLENLMPFLPKELKALQENYKCMTEESASSSKDRFDYCKEMLQESFRPLPANILYARKYLPEDKRENVQKIFTNIKEELKNLVMESTWIDDESKEKVVEMADNLIEVIGAPSDYLNDSVFDMYENHHNENSEDTTFLSMLLRHVVIEKNLIFNRLNIPVNSSQPDLSFYDLATYVFTLNSIFDNSIVIPAGLLQGIFYDPERPMFLNYGSIGSMIGRDLIMFGFDISGNKLDKDGNADNIWTEDTLKAFVERTQCINKMNESLTLENIADLTGIRLSYAAYNRWIEENGDEPQLPGIDYTQQQLFWISAISSKCYHLLRVELKDDINKVIKNNEDFGNDFDCPADSNMNPSEKCQVF